MPKGIPSSYIIAADKSYTLDFGDKGTIDCCEFLHYVTQAQRCTNEYESIELIEKALSYYGGDLLPEDMYEEWTHSIEKIYKSHYILGCLHVLHTMQKCITMTFQSVMQKKLLL